MIDLGACEITSLFGPMASGKTYLIEKVWIPTLPRYVRFDSTGESISDPSVIHVWRSPRELYERLRQSPYCFRIAYHPGENIQTDFEFCVQALWRMGRYSNTPRTIICDEFHEVCSVNETPAFVQTMMRYARHAMLAVIGASQRIADVHKLFTSGSRKVVIFHTREARDLDAVRQRWGVECEEMVVNLRPLLYNDVTKQAKQVPQCVVIERGFRPKIYDFQSDQYLDYGTESEPFEEVEAGGGESLGPSGELGEEVQLQNSEDHRPPKDGDS